MQIWMVFLNFLFIIMWNTTTVHAWMTFLCVLFLEKRFLCVDAGTVGFLGHSCAENTYGQALVSMDRRWEVEQPEDRTSSASMGKGRCYEPRRVGGVEWTTNNINWLSLQSLFSFFLFRGWFVSPSISTCIHHQVLLSVLSNALSTPASYNQSTHVVWLVNGVTLISTLGQKTIC